MSIEVLSVALSSLYSLSPVYVKCVPDLSCGGKAFSFHSPVFHGSSQATLLWSCHHFQLKPFITLENSRIFYLFHYVLFCFLNPLLTWTAMVGMDLVSLVKCLHMWAMVGFISTVSILRWITIRLTWLYDLVSLSNRIKCYRFMNTPVALFFLPLSRNMSGLGS